MYSQSAHLQEMSGSALFLLVVVFLMVYLMLTFYNPEFVQHKKHGHATGENDVAVTMLWALGITIAILVVLALLWYAFSCHA